VELGPAIALRDSFLVKKSLMKNNCFTFTVQSIQMPVKWQTY